MEWLCNIVNTLKATELFILKGLILCHMNFTSGKKKKKQRHHNVFYKNIYTRERITYTIKKVEKGQGLSKADGKANATQHQFSRGPSLACRWQGAGNCKAGLLKPSTPGARTPSWLAAFLPFPKKWYPPCFFISYYPLVNLLELSSRQHTPCFITVLKF